MTPRRSVVVVAAVACAAACFKGSPAQAQSWRSDLRHAEGPGFRVGNLELHPGVGAEVGWDSNVFLRDENPTGSGLLRLTPHLDLSTLGSQRTDEVHDTDYLPKVAFRSGLGASYYQFFNDEVNDNVAANLGGRLIFMPQRRISGSIYNNYVRTIRPFTAEGALGNNYIRNSNRAGGSLEYQSRSRVVTAGLDYAFGIDLLPSESFEFANQFLHIANANSAWNFLPSTQLFYDFRLEAQDFRNEQIGASALNSDSNRIRTRLGLRGAILPTLSATAAVGYAGGFYDEDRLTEYDNAVAQAELRWRPRESIKVALGYDRDFFISLFGGFYRRDRGYASVSTIVLKALSLSLEAWAGLLDYGRTIAADGSPLGVNGDTSREDIMVQVDLFVEYRVLSWLAFTGSARYTGDFTDFEFQSNAAGVPIAPAGYHKVDVFGGVRAFY